MDRQVFGAWGADLTDEELAAAIARVGLSGKWPPPAVPAVTDPVLPPWRTRRGITQWWCAGWPPPAEVPARAYAEDWLLVRQYVEKPLRFEIEILEKPSYRFVNSVAEALQMAGVQATFVAWNARVRRGDWQWPLRVAMLQPNGEIGRMEFAYPPWANRLLELEDLQKRRSFDILVYFGSPSDLPLAVSRLRVPYRVHLVAIVDCFAPVDLQHWEEPSHAASRIGARGMVHIRSPRFNDWLLDCLAKLSHNEPLDLAVAWANYNQGGHAGGTLWASRQFLADSLLAPSAERLVVYYAQRMRNEPIVLRDDVAERLELPHVAPASEVLRRLEARIPEIGWAQEKGGAAVTADVGRAVRQVSIRQRSQIAERQARFLTVDVGNQDGTVRRQRNAPLMPGFEYRIGVSIAPSTRQTIGEFPEERLPPNEDGHLLAIVLFDPSIMAAPLMDTLFLPPTGRSEICWFDVLVRETDRDQLNARITVLYDNRVLQTAILRAPIGDAAAERWQSDVGGARKNEVREILFDLAPEGAAAYATDSLDDRTASDLALVLNKHSDRPGALLVSGVSPAYIRLDATSINAAIQQISALLERSDWDLPTFSGLFASGTVKLLRDLAVEGSHLHDAIVKDYAKQFEPATVRRLQVVAAETPSQLPVEFIYDKTPPSQNATLCPNASVALEKGECEPSCPIPQDGASPVICPLGFWCHSRTIEWHAFAEERVEALRGAKFAIQGSNAARPQHIRLLHNTVIGYSARVTQADRDSIGRLRAAFTGNPNLDVELLEDWSQWKPAMMKRGPTLVVLLVHCEKQGRLSMMEIGPPDGGAPDQHKMKASLHLTTDDVRPGAAPTPPIVLLLGCGTGKAQVPFQALSGRFTTLGAAIVVSTISDIYGPRAADIAAEFVRAFATLPAGETFGDVLQKVRRQSLREGNPMALCLRAYGDADWALGQ